MTTTDDESGLSQLATDPEELRLEGEPFKLTFHVDAPLEGNDECVMCGNIIEKGHYDTPNGNVLCATCGLRVKALEAASEKYRQSRKSLAIVLQERKESYERNLADPTTSHSEKRAIASWLNELEHIMNLIQDVQKLEEAKPAATIQGKAESAT